MHASVLPLFRALLVILVLAPGPAFLTAHAAGLGGAWEGQVTQVEPPMSYPMEMNLYGAVGNIRYPSLGCSGNLEFIKTDGTSFWYRERITSGKEKCIDGGTIQLRRHPLGDATAWDWQWEGGGTSVRGVVRGSASAESK